MRRILVGLLLVSVACGGGSIATRGVDSVNVRLDSLEQRVDRLERAASARGSGAPAVPADTNDRRSP
jgi:hypothetical protein